MSKEEPEAEMHGGRSQSRKATKVGRLYHSHSCHSPDTAVLGFSGTNYLHILFPNNSAGQANVMATLCR